MTLPQLKRVRWAVRLALALGVAASIAGNVLHARDSVISQIISAWSPLALLLTIELISRVPVHRRSLAVGRWLATSLIAGIAAWVSYWHMAAVASRYGETGGAQYLLPLSVDGLVVVASISLVELSGRIAAAGDATRQTVSVTADTVPPPVPVDVSLPVESHPEDLSPDADVASPPPAADVTPRPVRRRPKSLTSAEKVSRAAAKMPGATPAQIAARAGVSESTARRHLPAAPAAVDPVGVASPTGPDAAQTPDLTDADNDGRRISAPAEVASLDLIGAAR